MPGLPPLPPPKGKTCTTTRCATSQRSVRVFLAHVLAAFLSVLLGLPSSVFAGAAVVAVLAPEPPKAWPPRPRPAAPHNFFFWMNPAAVSKNTCCSPAPPGATPPPA
eukprot:CAMPEP_0174837072 /NCGR_PEP_ID=MMETSP1114-20130205/6499_1 /TAXON_ID=312471 /ORGANISM="Neobodo designis, Strain CCAP 1951/1" /LENGTH=106 /DNA_ID=CAMNT_0016071113 /DNA_START=14 /DNA_END=332 /DNA_ORIENTATION=+